MNSKIISLKKAQEIRKALKMKHKKVVFTNGCFDILHLGHVRYLVAAKRLGDILIIGLNTDKSIKSFKDPARPINPEKQRAELMAALQCVDYVVLFSDDTPQKLIEKIIPDILVKGADYKRGEIVGEDIVRENGGVVRRIRLEKGFSTTNLIKKIKAL